MTLAVFVFVYPFEMIKAPQKTSFVAGKHVIKNHPFICLILTWSLFWAIYFFPCCQSVGHNINISRIFIQKKTWLVCVCWREPQGVSWLERLKRLPEHLWIWSSGTQKLGIVKKLGESDDFKCIYTYIHMFIVKYISIYIYMFLSKIYGYIYIVFYL